MKQFLRVVVLLLIGTSLMGSQSASAASQGAIVHVTLTSKWKTPSPDPMGITYDPRTHSFLVSDTEVDETPLWRGRNLFVARLKGGLVSARSLTTFTKEPEDLALDARHRTLYVVDDNLRRVFKDKPGKDGLFGTKDDVAQAILRTRRFNSVDPEGLAWFGPKKMLILSDSGQINHGSPRIYKIRKGRDGRFGTRDDRISSFGVQKFGFTTAEDVAVTRFTHHLMIVDSRRQFILETTLKGKLVRKIDLTGLGIRAPSGITFAPGTDGSKSRLYITDSGIDNNVDPSENDGRIFELKIVKGP